MNHWLGLAALPRLTDEQAVAYEKARAADRGHALSRMTVTIAAFYLFYALVDTLILGCTHYPLLSGVISYIMGDEVTLVSSADECARATFATLQRRGLLREGGHRPARRFVTTGDPARFEGLGSRLMGGFVSGVQQVGLD